MAFRLKTLEKCKDDPIARGIIMAECTENPLFFTNIFGWTYDPRREESEVPFITYDYQDDHILGTIDCIDKGQDNISEKSRDMGFSWDMVNIHVWAWRFKKWDSLYGSYKEDYVDEQGNMDSFFERVRYFIQRLPKWMRPPDMIDKYMSISSKTLGAEIAGDSGQNFGTGGRRKFITLDEFPLWQYAQKAFRKTSDITKCRCFGGTPEGKLNVYGKIMTDHKDYRHLKMRKFTLHWTLHPEKGRRSYNADTLKPFNSRKEAFEAWKSGVKVSSPYYEEEKGKRLKLDMAKELDISYDDSVTGAVYPSFSKVVTFGKFEFDPTMPLYTSWDFGRDMTAILWIQHDVKNDRHIIIDAFQKSKDEMEDIEIDFFTAFFLGLEIQGFNYTEGEIELIAKHSPWKNKYIDHFGDPYNAGSKTINTKSSIADKLKEKGIHLHWKTGTTVEERITKTTLSLKKLCVNEDLFDFIQAIQQSKYPSEKENSEATAEKTKPIHNIYSHYRTALEYYFDNEPKILRPQTSPEELKIKRQELRRINPGSAILRRSLTNNRRTVIF